MPNYLSELLSFSGMGQDDPVDLRSLLEQPGPAMPAPRKFTPMQVPARPQQHWAELIPQILAGAGDVMTARGRGRSDHLGRVMGIQEGRRNQAWGDSMLQAQLNQQSQNAEYEDQWRRYVGEQTGRDRKFNQGMKVAEFDLMKSMLDKQKADAEKNTNFQKFMYGVSAQEKLKDAGGPEDLKEMLSKAMLTAKSPEELQALQEQFNINQGQMTKKAAQAAELQAEYRKLIEESKRGGTPYHLWTQDAFLDRKIWDEARRRVEARLGPQR